MHTATMYELRTVGTVRIVSGSRLRIVAYMDCSLICVRTRWTPTHPTAITSTSINKSCILDSRHQHHIIIIGHFSAATASGVLDGPSD